MMEKEGQEREKLDIDPQDVSQKFDSAIVNSQISWVPTQPIHLTDQGFQVPLPYAEGHQLCCQR